MKILNLGSSILKGLLLTSLVIVLPTCVWAVPDRVWITVDTSPITEGTGIGQFTVVLNDLAETNTVIGYTVAGSATSADYVPPSGSVTIPTGASSAPILVNLVNDTIVEVSETIVISLDTVSVPSTLITTPVSAELTINDDDSGEVSVTASDATAGEPGDDGQFTVTLSNTSSTATTIDYTVGGSASSGVDYAALGGSITIGSGLTSGTIDVEVLDDSILEADETLSLTLGAITSGDADLSVVAGSSADITISDDDSGEVSVTASDATAGEPGDDGQFTVTLSNASSTATTINYTVGGSASSGVDYAALGGSITIGSGLTSGTIELEIMDDGEVEYDETIIITLDSIDASSDPEISIASPETATVTIADNDWYLNLHANSQNGGSGSITHQGGTSVSASGSATDIITTGNTEIIILSPDEGSCVSELTGITRNDGRVDGPVFPRTFPADYSGVIDPVASQDYDVIATFSPQVTITVNVFPEGNQVDDPAGVTDHVTWAVYGFTDGVLNSVPFSSGNVSGDTIAVDCHVEDYRIVFSSLIGWQQPASINGTITSATFASGNLVYDAEYRTLSRLLRLNDSGGSGTGIVSLNPEGDLLPNTSYEYLYESNSRVYLQAVSENGSVFVGWQGDLPDVDLNGDPIDPTNSEISFQMTQDRTINALFVLGCDDNDGDSFRVDPGDGSCIVADGIYDCNDGDITVYPGAPDICGDNIDSNCGYVLLNGTLSAAPVDEETCGAGDLDIDGDGYTPRMGDCFDDVGTLNGVRGRDIHPGATDDCNTVDVDEDCFGGPGWEIGPDGDRVQTENGQWESGAFWNHIDGNRPCGAELTCEVRGSDYPLNTAISPAPPLVMVMFDDSGSMDWQTMTDEPDGAFEIGSRLYYQLYDDSDNVGGWRTFSSDTHRRMWKSQWYSYNAMYYNPAVLYQPWPRWYTSYVDVNDGVSDNPPDSALFRTSLTDTLAAIGTTPDSEILWQEGEFVHAHLNKPRLNPVDQTDFSRGSNGNGANYRDLNEEPWLIVDVGRSSERGRIRIIREDDPLQGGHTDWEYTDSTIADAVGLDGDSSISASGAPDAGIFDEASIQAVSGTWVNNSLVSGGQSGTSFYHTDINPDPSTGAGSGQIAEWVLNIPNEGRYYPYAYWPQFGGGGHTYVPDNNARYTLSYWDCSGGSPVFREDIALDIVDQTTGYERWQNLGAGRFHFCEDVADEPVEIAYSHYFVALDSSDNITDIEDDIAKVYLVNIHWDETNGEYIQEYFQYFDDGDEAVEDGELTRLDITADIPDAIRAKKIDTQGNIVIGIDGNPVYLTALEERQAFVDWYSFYRRRELAAKAATGLMIETVAGMEVGIYSIHKRATLGVLPIDLVDMTGTPQDFTDQLLRELYVGVYTSQGSTPLRQSYVDTATYFDSSGNQDAGRLGTKIFSNPWGEPGDGGSCQKAYIISMSDGHWNQTMNNIGDWDTPSTPGPYDAEIYRDRVYSGNTLADIAMKYYKTDLQPDLDDDVPARGYDTAPYQHIVPYTVAFGVKGDINPNHFPDCLPDEKIEDFPVSRFDPDSDTLDADREYKGRCPDWPDIENGSATKEKVDDVYHAAINGRGAFIQADNPQELIKGLLKIYELIRAQIATASSVSLNAQKIKTDALLYQTVYQKRDWAGNLFAICLDSAGEEVNCVDGSGNDLGTEVKWTAHDVAEFADSAGTWWNDRQVLTFNDNTDSGVPFRFGSISSEQENLLNDDVNLLNYLRGDRSQEGVVYRERVTYYGDFVHSAPTNFASIVLAGSNGGMLHIFEEETGEEILSYVPNVMYKRWVDSTSTSGVHEPKLATLADFDYQHKHQYFVDGTVAIEYLEDNNTTIVTGAYGKGGKGLFALNLYGLYGKKADGIEANHADSMVMWEYPAAHKDKLELQVDDRGTADTADDLVSLTEIVSGSDSPTDSYSTSMTAASTDPYLGYIYGKPEVVKIPDSGGGFRWAVVFGNGYESYNQTAVLYILDAYDGSVIKRIFTTRPEDSANPCSDTTCSGSADINCNGLSTPTLVDLDLDGIIDFAYAGDLLGNMWKFDFTEGFTGGPDSYKVAFSDSLGTPKPLISVRSSIGTGKDGKPGMRQPITAKPTVTLPCSQSANGVMVIFGTGRFIGSTDLNDVSMQSMYGIWDWQASWAEELSPAASRGYYYGELGISATDSFTCAADALTDCENNCTDDCATVEASCLSSCEETLVDPTAIAACQSNCNDDRLSCESTCAPSCSSASGVGFDELSCTTSCYTDYETCLASASGPIAESACNVALSECDSSCRGYWDSYQTCMSGRPLDNVSNLFAPNSAKFVTLLEQSQIYFAGITYYKETDQMVIDGLVEAGDLENFVYNPANYKEFDDIVRILSDNSIDWFNFEDLESGYPDETKHVGWYLNFPLTGERMVVDPLVLDGTLFYATAIPSSSPCKSGGYSIIMGHDSCTGGRLPSVVFDLNSDGSLEERDFVNLFGQGVGISGVLYEGIVPAPTITSTLTNDIMFVPGNDPTDGSDSDDGDVTDTRTSVDKTIVKGKNLGIYFWRELDW